MQQVVGCGVLVSHDLLGHAMQAVETVQTEAPEYGVDRLVGDPSAQSLWCGPKPWRRLTEQMRRPSSGDVRRGWRR
jgi:hypothetical protein